MFSFRKSINFGLFRINFSKSGIGFSFGPKGAKFGIDSKGRKYTNLSIPKTGLSFKKFFSNKKKNKKVDF